MDDDTCSDLTKNATSHLETSDDTPTPDALSQPAPSTSTNVDAESVVNNTFSLPTEHRTPFPMVENDPANQIYSIKWHEHKTPIVMQNENGPCPLLAVINVLLLRGQIQLIDHVEFITGQQLMTHLGDCILRLAPKEMPTAMRQDYEQNVSDAMGVLNKMMTGLDVNVKFTGCDHFEYTPECIVFDLLNIPLRHGWLLEPDQTEYSTVVGSFSYNQLVELIVEGQSSTDTDVKTNALLAEQFLESTASQLTMFGLEQLNQSLKEETIGVLFRNNHFSVICKHEDHLYLLVTDQGFLSENNVVWESLQNIEGDSFFVDASFVSSPWKVEEEQQPHKPVSQVDNDYLVALSLQQQNSDQVSIAKILPKSETDMDLELAMQLQEEEEMLARKQQKKVPPVSIEGQLNQGDTGGGCSSSSDHHAADWSNDNNLGGVGCHSGLGSPTDQSERGRKAEKECNLL